MHKSACKDNTKSMSLENSEAQDHTNIAYLIIISSAVTEMIVLKRKPTLIKR